MIPWLRGAHGGAGPGGPWGRSATTEVAGPQPGTEVPRAVTQKQRPRLCKRLPAGQGGFNIENEQHWCGAGQSLGP